MKDIKIKWRWIKRELIIVLSLYVIVNLVNVVAIIIYATPWKEFYTSQGYILFFTEWIYIATIAIRLFIYGIRYILKKK